MNKIIIYGSRYGHAKKYALELSGLTNIEGISINEINDISNYKTVIYIGSIYADNIFGLKKMIKILSKDEEQEFILITVGLGNPKNREITDNIKRHVSKKLPRDILIKTKIFHLRGGVDRSKLGSKHRFMMSYLIKNHEKTPVEQRTADVQEMIDSYNDKIELMNFDDLKNIMEYLKL